jgi:hypothetical protein
MEISLCTLCCLTPIITRPQDTWQMTIPMHRVG